MNKEQLVKWINELMEKDEMWRFYKSKLWQRLANEVLKEYHFECQVCLKKGKLTRANTVHHINEVKVRPDLALSKYYIDELGNKRLNLMPICFECHNKVHKRFIKKEQLNEERW